MKKITIRLTEDALIQALEAIPHGYRQTMILAALRAYWLPGGQQEVLRRLDQVLHCLEARTMPAKPSATPLPPDQEAVIAANRTAILGAFGIAGEED